MTYAKHPFLLSRVLPWILSWTKAFTYLVLACGIGLSTYAIADSQTVVGSTASNDGITLLHNNTQSKSVENRDLDVVLVMDSSGSMKKNDPKELRKPAAKLFISLLGKNDRVSIISFSDQGYPVAFLTPAGGNANRRELFKAVDRISSKGVYTNLNGAIEGALRVLDKDAAGHSANTHRQRVIVLMSDGKMDLGNNESNEQQTQRLMLDTLPALKRQGIEVHTIAFTPKSDQALLKKIADATDGTFNISRTDKDLHDVYTAIFEQNKSPNILPFHGEKFNIDKAIKEVTIVGSKDSAQVVLALITPDGRMLTPQDKGKNLKWFVSDQFDLITISQPASGEWKLKASAGKNKAYVITDLKQQLEIAPHKPVINEGVLIKTWLEDKGTILNKPSILHSLSVEMHVDTPDGQTHLLKMEPEQAADGTPANSGAFTSLIALPAEGAYRFKVIASTGTFSREKDSIIHATLPPQATQSPAMLGSNTQPGSKPAVTSTPPVTTTPPAIKPEAEAQTSTTQPTDEAGKSPAAPDTEQKPSEEKAKKPAEKNLKDKHKKITKHKPAKKDEKAKDAAHKDGNSSVLVAILIFLGINVMMGAIGGGVFWFMRRKRKSAATDTDSDEADSPPAKADAKQAEKTDKAA